MQLQMQYQTITIISYLLHGIQWIRKLICIPSCLVSLRLADRLQGVVFIGVSLRLADRLQDVVFITSMVAITPEYVFHFQVLEVYAKKTD